MTLHFIGDSIVQNYKTEEFIAGWGQYLPLYLEPNVEVLNHAIGGRSSRSFINEGRFDKAFKQVKAGDYVFIEFCHNDDASKPYNTIVNRLVELGEPDEDGRYPIIPGEPVAKNYIPQEFIRALKEDDSVPGVLECSGQNDSGTLSEEYMNSVASDNEVTMVGSQVITKSAVLANAFLMLSEYPGDSYYPYSADASKGSFKWFLKQYVDEARERGAVPVIVTAPARGVLDAQGRLADGPMLHGGDNFCFIRAAKQLAQEMKVPVIDLFEYSRELYEGLGVDKVRYLMSVKKGNNQGVWPQDYDVEVDKAETVMENTHFNKFGACLIAREMAKVIAESGDWQLADLQSCVKLDGVKEVAPKMLEGVL